ncbi:zinc finger protein 569-like [Vespula maculifrons]|uniref:Zinc finger protein 569-like n=1 Tax=Vespula maculifrons TaxID=7453 RepID=A0ABD2CLF3_VESMC
MYMFSVHYYIFIHIPTYTKTTSYLSRKKAIKTDFVQSEMITMGMPDSYCVICNTNVDVSSCVNIFYTSLPHNGELLASFALRELRPTTSNLHSSYICPRCYKLFQMLEQAQWTVTNIRCEILKVYQSGEKKKFVRRMLTNNTDYLLHNTQILEGIQTTKRDIDQTINGLKNIADITSTSFMQDVSLEQISQTFNANMTTNNIKNIDLIDTKDIFKEEIDIDSKNLDNIHSNIRSNNNCNMEYKNSNDVNKNIKTEIHNKTIDLNVKILENDFHKSILTNNSIEERNITEQETSYNQCKFCTESFKTNDELNVHLLKHNDIQLYQCSKCKEVFTNISLANTHASKVHIEDQDYVNILPVSYKNEIGHFLNDVSFFPQNNVETLKPNTFEHTEINKNISEIKDNSACITGKCNQCNSLYQKGHTCNEHTKVQCNSDNNITTTEKNLKNTSSDNNKTWVEINQSKLNCTSNETEFVLLQDSSSQGDTTPVTITFNDHKMSVGNKNYNTSLKIIIESSNVSIPINNQVIIDDTHT